ncbi:MAG: efflux RND transporter periplasmic adaptor subunit [Rhizobium sp.]|nr:efflux RND transporter periplasmic adaptor subunit [Rhizobium sp.]
MIGRLIALLLAGACLPFAADAGTLTLQPTAIPELKAVYGQVEARDSVLARSRIGGTMVDLRITEGDTVKAGDVIAVVKDDKIDFQIKAVDAQLLGLQASLKNAVAELERAERLIKSGAATAQRLDQIRTETDVIRNQIAATEAQRSVLVEQANEGDVLAPGDGRVLKVPVTQDAVVMPGEVVANIGGGGFYLRLAIPERHAMALRQGAQIRISAAGEALSGTLAKIYPQIENGRVIADVEVEKLNTEFVNARVLVELPIGERRAIVIPRGALVTRSGIDFVSISENGKTVERAVIAGQPVDIDGVPGIEILTGLVAGDILVTP